MVRRLFIFHLIQGTQQDHFPTVVSLMFFVKTLVSDMEKTFEHL
jgi:hypothetical protein